MRVAVLGSTGSIGVSTLDVLARHPDRFESLRSRRTATSSDCASNAWRIARDSRWSSMRRRRRQLSSELREAGAPTECWPASEALERDRSHRAGRCRHGGHRRCRRAALEPGCGAAGKRILLANKEALVMSGPLFMQAVREGGATLIPVDSEHNAIFQCHAADAGQRARRRAADPADRLRRSVPAARRRRTAERDAGAGLRPSALGHGPQDLGGFRHADEQGTGADRGLPAVRLAAGAGRSGRASAEHRAFAGRVRATVRCWRSWAIPTCARRSRMRWAGRSASPPV